MRWCDRTLLISHRSCAAADKLELPPVTSVRPHQHGVGLLVRMEGKLTTLPEVLLSKRLILRKSRNEVYCCR